MSFPPGAPFALHVVAICDHEVLVHVEGDLDLATAPQLEAVLKREMSASKTVVLDLSQLAFMDCTGLRAILSAIQDSRDNGHELKHTSPLPAQVRRLVEMTGTQDAFSVTNDAVQAPSRPQLRDERQSSATRDRRIRTRLGAAWRRPVGS